MEPRVIVEKLVKQYGYRAVMGLVELIGESIKQNDETEDEMMFRFVCNKVERVMRRRKLLQRSELLRHIGARGIKADLATRIMDSLVDNGKVAIYRDRPVGRVGKVATYYKWVENEPV